MSILIDADGERIDVAAASSVNSLDAMTIVMWEYATSISGGTAQNLMSKGPNNSQWLFFRPGADINDLSFFHDRATTDTLVRSSVSLFASNAWRFIAATDENNVAPRLYWGSLTQAVAEVSSYNLQMTGVGSPADDSANGIRVGVNQTSSGQNNAKSRFAYIQIYNRRLSLGELESLQWRMRALSGCVLFLVPGYNGTGTQTDYSGNGNHGTIVSTASVADHVPIPFRRCGPLWMPKSVASKSFPPFRSTHQPRFFDRRRAS